MSEPTETTTTGESPATPRVSDFRVAEGLLRAACRSLGVPFVDAPIRFEHGDHSWGSHDGHSVVVPIAGGWPQTQLAIVGHYLDAIDLIVGREVGLDDHAKDDFAVTAAAALRDLTYPPATGPSYEGEGVRPLSSFPAVWLLLRDVLCPANSLPLRDLRVSADRSVVHDVAAAGTVRDPRTSEVRPVLFVNTSVPSAPVRAAFLTVAALKGLGADPAAVVSAAASDDFVAGKVREFAKLAHAAPDARDDARVFLTTLAGAAGLLPGASLLDGEQAGPFAKLAATLRFADRMDKRAQVTSRFPSQNNYEGVAMGVGGGVWTIPTLTEGMLGAVRPTRRRGENPVLKGLRDEIWNRVSAEKARLGKDDMALEDLLRAQSKGMRVARGATLQALLTEQRVW